MNDMKPAGVGSLWCTWCGSPNWQGHLPECKKPKNTAESTTGNEIDPGGVAHPSHYNLDQSGVECIEIVRWMDFNLGSAYKYVFRAGLKVAGDWVDSEKKDIDKAIWYLTDLQQFEAPGYTSYFEIPEYVYDKMGRVIQSREGELMQFFGHIYNHVQTRARRSIHLNAAIAALQDYRATL